MRAARRQFLKDGLWTVSSLLGVPALPAIAREGPATRPLPAGVHLFVDSGLVARERNLRRVIHPPAQGPGIVVGQVHARGPMADRRGFDRPSI